MIHYNIIPNRQVTYRTYHKLFVTKYSQELYIIVGNNYIILHILRLFDQITKLKTLK